MSDKIFSWKISFPKATGTIFSVFPDKVLTMFSSSGSSPQSQEDLNFPVKKPSEKDRLKKSAIHMERVFFRYGEKKILQDFNLTIEHNKFYCLVGSSGSGKTTVLYLIKGLLKPEKGTIFINGKGFDFNHPEKLRRAMGYSIQGSGLFPHMTLFENLSIIANSENWNKKDIRNRVNELCDMLSIPNTSQFLNKKPRELSGGQRQRVGIARALFMKPRILLMDEPFSALDPITRSELQKEFLRLQSQLKLTILLVTHDLSEAFNMGDEIILLNKGQVEQKDRPSKFLLTPKSNYVANFIRSHSPGNRLKEIYLYSVINSDIFVSYQKKFYIYVENLDSGETHKFSDQTQVVEFLISKSQTTLYWVNHEKKFLNFQSLESGFPKKTSRHFLYSTQHILDGMKEILNHQANVLPVVDKNKKLIGVFSQGALDVL